MTVAETIKGKLEAALAPDLVEIEDESERHKGHAGYREGGGTHFRILIVSPAFEGKSRIARQRLVYEALAELMNAPVHALALRTLTPAEHAAR